jgi:hypothetical protein
VTATDPLFQLAAEKDRETIEVLDAKIGQLQRETRMLQAVLALKGSAGWQEYEKAISAYREAFAGQALDLKQERREYWSGAVYGISFLLKLITDSEIDFKKRSEVLKLLIEKRNSFVKDGRVIPDDPWLVKG